MNTCGTDHVDANDFADWFNDASHGERFVYAIGNLAHACYFGEGEILLVRDLAQKFSDKGTMILLQRPSGATAFGWRRFEYIAVKRSPFSKEKSHETHNRCAA